MILLLSCCETSVEEEEEENDDDEINENDDDNRFSLSSERDSRFAVDSGTSRKGGPKISLPLLRNAKSTSPYNMLASLTDHCKING